MNGDSSTPAPRDGIPDASADQRNDQPDARAKTARHIDCSAAQAARDASHQASQDPPPRGGRDERGRRDDGGGYAD